jgi:hypothetical protein
VARSLTVAAHNYLAGSYGPFAINGFLSSNTDYLQITLTVEAWPDVSPLITLSMNWDTGDAASVTIPGRQNASTAVIRLGVPKNSSGKVAVSSASASIVIAQSMRTAVMVEALAD